MTVTENSLNDGRIDREREFHNQRFTHETRQSQHKYYDAIADGQEAFRSRVAELAEGSDCLEFGCGSAPLAIELAASAQSIVGIDISDVAVDACARAATAAGANNATFQRMNAEALEFADESFDFVFGTGIVHHLDVERSMREAARTLRPGGTAFFWEPLGDNPVWNAYRRRTPGARTPDEHPLTKEHLEVLGRLFSTVKVNYYGLTTLAAVPFRKTKAFPHIHRVLRYIDRQLFRVDAVARWAWFASLELSDPAN